MRRIIFLLMELLLLCSCAKQKPNPDLPDEDNVRIPINISTSVWVKATETGYEEGDKVGIYIVNQTNGTKQSLKNNGNHADNIRHTFQNSLWKSEKDFFWLDQTTLADFYCYYPYTSNVPDVRNLDFSVQTNQSRIENYKKSEFLWGVTENQKPTPDPVLILTNHLMSRLEIYLKPGKGYNEESFSKVGKSVEIVGLQNQCSIDMSTGNVTPVGDVKNIVPFFDNNRYLSLVVPQTINDTPLVLVKINKDTYTLKQTMTFEPNHTYRCTLVINRIGEGVDIEIGGWESDGNDYGGTLN